MSNVLNQKKLASKLFKSGIGRVWIDPNSCDKVSEAITREDIRKLISEKIIKLKSKKGVSRGRTRLKDIKIKYGHRKGPGSRRGKKGSRTNKKELWIKKIRSLRKVLKEYKLSNTIDKKTYCLYYKKIKGGEFRNISHLKSHINDLNK